MFNKDKNQKILKNNMNNQKANYKNYKLKIILQ